MMNPWLWLPSLSKCSFIIFKCRLFPSLVSGYLQVFVHTRTSLHGIRYLMARIINFFFLITRNFCACRSLLAFVQTSNYFCFFRSRYLFRNSHRPSPVGHTRAIFFCASSKFTFFRYRPEMPRGGRREEGSRFWGKMRPPKRKKIGNLLA